jgi:hypothetical protein
MWSLNRRQWVVIYVVAAVLLLAWPSENGSLGVKLVRWAADPMHTLPVIPAELPPGLDDNGDAVTEYDVALAEYYRRYNESDTTKWRMDLKEAQDPFDRTTERQLLVALGVMSVLVVGALKR